MGAGVVGAESAGGVSAGWLICDVTETGSDGGTCIDEADGLGEVGEEEDAATTPPVVISSPVALNCITPSIGELVAASTAAIASADGVTLETPALYPGETSVSREGSAADGSTLGTAEDPVSNLTGIDGGT